MGFFTSLREINRQAEEIDRNFDPGAQMRQSLAQMQQLRQQMAGQQATAHLATTGMPATATIISVRETGAYVNNLPNVELQLMVNAAGRPPYPATHTSLVPLTGIGQLRPGAEVAIHFDPLHPTRLTVMWGQPT